MVIMLMMSSLTLSGCYLFPDEEEVLAPPLKQPQQIKYETIDVVRGDIKKEVKCIAYVRPYKQEELSFIHRSGYLRSIEKEYGDEVVKGEILAELETDSIKLDIKKQEIQVENKRIQYEDLQGDRNVQIDLAKLELNKLEKEYETMVELEGSYSSSQLNNAQQKIAKQKIMLDDLEQTRKKKMRDAKRQLDLAVLELESLKEVFDNAVIRAPFDGTVTYISDLKSGELVQIREAIVTVADNSRLYLEYNGNKSGQYEKGQSIKATINSKAHTGRVISTSDDVPKEDYERLKDRVLFDLDTWPENVVADRSVKVVSLINSNNDVILIPKGLVSDYKGRRFVRVLENGLVTERDVEVGITNETMAEIVQGLKEGEKIVK